ncbi:MAG: hypothetical protein ACI89X_001345 [Planctomycetota bacterium]|jgi:hypothetical protein
MCFVVLTPLAQLELQPKRQGLAKRHWPDAEWLGQQHVTSWPNWLVAGAPLSDSQQQFLHDATFHIRQPAFQPVVVVGQPFVIEPQQMQDRRVEVVHRNGA